MDLVPALLVLVAPDATTAWPNAAALSLASGDGWLRSLKQAGLLQPTPAAAELSPAPVEGHRVAVDATSNPPGLRARSQPQPTGGWIIACERIDSFRGARAEPGPVPGSTGGEPASPPAMVADLVCALIWRHDLSTNLLHFNAHALAQLGLPTGHAGVPLQDFRDRIHAGDLPLFDTSTLSLQRADGPIDSALRILGGDGRWLELETKGCVQRDGAGQPVALIWAGMDAGERQETLRRERDWRRRLEVVIRTAGVGHWIAHFDASTAQWSEQLRAIHELAPHETVPDIHTWRMQWLHVLDRQRVQERVQAWLLGRQASLSLDLRIVLRNGNVRHLYTHARREWTDGQPTVFGVAVDITELREAESAARSAAERVALATHSAGMGTWELDLREDVSRWDAQMWRLRGREPQPRAMSKAERMTILHPDDHERISTAHDAAMATDAPAEFEFRVIWPDGQVRWLASRSIVQHEDAGPPRRRIGVNWDITDQRTNAEVRQEREIALRENAAKSRFMSRISHELRTPLNAVLGFAQLILADEKADEPASMLRRQRLQHILVGGHHLLTLISDILDLSGIESGEMRIAMQPVQLTSLVRGTLPLLESLLAERGITLVCDGLSGEVMADPTRLRQVLLNLLSNAIKYNRPNGTVRVKAHPEGSGIVISIEDTGLGLDPAQQQRLFEPFNRLGAESSPVEGVGIGLLITRTLIERMGGRLAVSSQLGKGSVFAVWLRTPEGLHSGPRADVAPATAAPPAAQASPPSMRADSRMAQAQRLHRVLYVEDNEVNAIIMSAALSQRRDIELCVAVDGLSGVQRARDWLPDLVLLDMQLPDIDGMEVMRRLRADSATANTPCIAVSANAIQEDIELTLRAGAAGYWTKPLDLPAFQAALDSLLGPEPA